MYAVVQTGGKQHKVSVGQRFQVEKLAGAAEVGNVVELDQVLMIGDEGTSQIGRPLVEGARVVAEVVDPDAKGKKLIVFKYKSKVRYRKKTGHRQHYTELKVTDILTDGAKPAARSAEAAPAAEEAPARPSRRRASAQATAAAEAEKVEQAADETVAAVEAEEKKDE